VKRFLKNSALFTAGLVCLLLLTDAGIGQKMRKARGDYPGLIGGTDVYPVLERAAVPGPDVRTIYLGDSVSRQLFRPGAEPKPQVLYLSSNQAISMAGQYHLLRQALDNCPHAREVDLFYMPLAWRNDLPRVMSHDYYCGYFHAPGQIAETFRATRDCGLLAAHVGRWLLPNLMAANSASHPAVAAPAPELVEAEAAPASDPEPLLTAATRICRALPGYAPPPQAPAQVGRIKVSNVSQYFLAKIRTLCRERGCTLRVLPSPCSSRVRYQNVDQVYDAEVLYFDPFWFRDGIHLLGQHLPEVRRRMIEKYQLKGPEGAMPVTSGQSERVLRACAAPDSVRCRELIAR
jgi:hypothetical protein